MSGRAFLEGVGALTACELVHQHDFANVHLDHQSVLYGGTVSESVGAQNQQDPSGLQGRSLCQDR